MNLFPYAMFGAALAFAAASLMGPEVGRIGVPVSLVFTSLGWFAPRTERRLGELSAELHASKEAVLAEHQPKGMLGVALRPDLDGIEDVGRREQ